MVPSTEVVKNAWKAQLTVPAFNVPYLPMVAPVVQAVRDTDSFAFVASARLEWFKFEGKGLKPVFDAYKAVEDRRHVRLHLDHVPVIDEDDEQVNYMEILKDAVSLGYDSVMVDGSRLELESNIEATRQAVMLAHAGGVPCEAELGAVFGHEAGPPPPYEELFASGRGFTEPEQARRFVEATRCDWLSVAIGNIHGAVSGTLRDRKKVTARLNIEHLMRLHDAAGVPLVLHGGSGIERKYVLEAVKHGVAKINIGMEIRQVYENALREHASEQAGQDAVYTKTSWILREFLEQPGTRNVFLGE